MEFMSARKSHHKIVKKEFKQMGAKFIDIQGIMFMVKFIINDNKITYAYHLNNDNTFFLERVKPYVLPIGDFQDELAVLEAVKEDIDQFINAMKSSNYKQFVEVDSHITQLVRFFEDLYLYYNISKDDLGKINTLVDEMLGELKVIKEKSIRAYTKNDPRYLKDNVEFDNSEN